MIDREKLDKRAAELGLDVPAKTSAKKLEEMIAEAEAKTGNVADAGVVQIDELKGKIEELEGALAEKIELLALTEAELAEKVALLDLLSAKPAATAKPVEGGVDCVALVRILHDGSDYLSGDRLTLGPDDFEALYASGDVAPLGETDGAETDG